MSNNQLLILDVGHGNCSVVTSNEQFAVIDAPQGPTLNDTLEELGAQKIKAVFVSHADADHIEGITSLLTNEKIEIEKIYVNPDASKDTKAWKHFRVAVADAAKRGAKAITSLNSSFPGEIKMGDVGISIIYPFPEVALSGAGGKDINDKAITSNSNSAVLKISHGNYCQVLLGGDMDNNALQNIRAKKENLKAEILVFPHHGGLPDGADPETYAKDLYKEVKPALVVFSNGRSNKYHNPRPEIIKGLEESGARIACTQISKNCIADTSSLNLNHLSKLPSKGMQTNSSCAGSMAFNLDNINLRILDRHADFVNTCIEEGLCRNLNCQNASDSKTTCSST